MHSLQYIREKERQSHIQMYSNSVLYEDKGWLQKPVKSITELIPLFKNQTDIHILDLGCGVGRNSIFIANQLRSQNCIIDCVDILDFAIEKLLSYAEKYHLSTSIRGQICSMEDYLILSDKYNWIIAVSSLEHIESTVAFIKKLHEIRDGIQTGGIVSLIINTNIKEFNKETGVSERPQFELMLTTQELNNHLSTTFSGWNVRKRDHQIQTYEIPRSSEVHILTSTVVTFVAQKP